MSAIRFIASRRERHEVLEAQYLFRLQTWALSLAPSVWLIDLQPYENCRVAGVIRKLRIDPVDGAIDAVITDGTAEVSARWQIRRPTPQVAIVPGRGVALEGLTIVAPDGSIALDEPRFEVFDLEFANEPDE